MRIVALASSAALVALLGCGGRDAPEDVAMEFWQAAVERDFDEAEPLSTATDEADVEKFLGSFAPKEAPAIGEPLTSEDRALVETTFLMHSDTPPLRFHTQLVASDGDWRVDLVSTGEELRRARIDLGIERAQDSLEHAKASKGSNATAQETADELRRAADEIDQAVADKPPADTQD